MENNHSTAQRQVKSVSCNMLHSTTYALNKSNSKRAIVGLEYSGGFYKPVVKLCTTGSPAKYVTLDKYGWELLRDQIELINAYLQDSYSFYQEFGNPTKVLLPNHDLNFTSCYGARAINIEERPLLPLNGKAFVQFEHNAQQLDTPVQQQEPCITEPPCKKKKHENPPSVVIHQSTFEGLKEVSECIDERLRQLEELAGIVNRGVDYILEFIKTDLGRQENIEKAENILKNNLSFKMYYSQHKQTINEIVKTNLNFATVSNDVLQIILLEMYAYGLHFIAKDLCDVMFPM